MTGAVALAQTNVYSRNAVGAVRVDIPPSGQFVMCGFNFTPLGSNEVSLLTLLGTNLPAHTSNPTRATRVYIWDPAALGGGGYLSVYLRSPSYQWHTILENTPTNPMLRAGAAFWIQSSQLAPTSMPVFIMGEVLSTNDIDRSLGAGFSMVANPYSAPLDLNDTNINWIADGATGHNTNPTRADNVYVWNGAGYNNFFLKLDGKWYDVITTAYASNAVIPVGAGAWYRARGAFTNSLVRPYPWW
jgi:hypothetical protein